MSINLAGEKLALFIKNLDPKDSVKLRLKPTRSPEDKTLRLRVGRTLRRPETGVPFRVLVPS